MWHVCRKIGQSYRRLLAISSLFILIIFNPKTLKNAKFHRVKNSMKANFRHIFLTYILNIPYK